MTVTFVPSFGGPLWREVLVDVLCTVCISAIALHLCIGGSFNVFVGLAPLHCWVL